MKQRFHVSALGRSFSRPRLRNRLRHSLTACSGITVYLCLAGPLAAQTWNGTTDNLWATGSNWSATPVPGSGGTAVFTNAGGTSDVIDLGAGVTINNIVFSTAGAAAYTLGTGAADSQTLILNNSGSVTLGAAAVNSQVINAALRLGTDMSAQTYTLTNNRPGSSLTLAGSVGGTTTGGTAGVKTLAIGGGGPVTFSGNLSVSGATGLTVTSGTSGTVTLAGTNALRSINVNGGAGSIVDLGSGTTTLSNVGTDGIKSTTGGTVQNGTIVLGSTNTATDGLDFGTANGTTLTLNSKISGLAANTFEYYYASTNTGVIVLGNPANDFAGNAALGNGVVSVASIGNVGAASALGAGNGTGIISLNTGTLRFTGATTTTNRVVNLANSGTVEASGTGLLKFSSAITADGGNSKTLTLGGTGTGEIAAAIVNNSGTNTTALLKTGTGSWALSGSPTFTGTTTVSNGILKLDYSVNNTTKLSDTTALTLSGGTIELAGGSHPEVVVSTTLTGASTITASSGSSYLALNAITPGSGSLNLTADNLATTDNANLATGILGYWASVGSGWAANSGVTDGAAATGNYVRGITYATQVARQSAGAEVIADGSTHVRIIEGSGTPAVITLGGTTTTTINSLVQSAEGGTAAGVIDATSKTLVTQAVLVTAGAGSLTLSNGTLTAGTAQGTLTLNNASTANNLIVNSVIANNGTTSPLSKLGAGTVELNATNTYTGLSTIGGGTVKLGNNAGLGASGTGNETVIVSGATLDLNGMSTAENFVGASTGGVQGVGVGSLGAIINSDTVNPATITGTITQAGAGTRDFTIGGPGNLTTYNIAGTTTIFTVTKEGAGQLTFGGAADNGYLAFVANAGTTVLAKTPSSISIHAVGGGFRMEGSAIVQLAGTGGDQIIDSNDATLNGSSILDLNGRSESINNLVGVAAAKVYNTANGTTSVLTVGSNSNSNTFNGILSDNAGDSQTGVLALTRTGISGTQTLTNNNTYTGATRLAGGGGGITLNFAAAGIGTDDNLISPLSALTLNNTSGSGTQTLRITGDTGVINNQTFNGTSVTGAGTRHQIAVTSGIAGTTNLNLGAFNLTSGAYVDFVLPASGTISTSNANTVLGLRATVNNGTSYAQILGGQIVGTNGDLAYLTATHIDALPGYAAASNLRVDQTSTGNAIQAAGTTNLSTIQFTDTTARTLTLGTGNTLQLGAPGGILRSATSGSVIIGEAGNAGEVTSGTASGDDLILTNANATGTLTLNSVIKDNAGGALDVFVNGSATATTLLAGSNTYTGLTTVQTGVLRATSNSALGSAAGGSGVLDGAALELSGGITIGDEALTLIGTGVGSGGALRNFSGTNTYQGLVTLNTAAEIQAEPGTTLIFDRAGTNPSLSSFNSAITFETSVTGIITFNDAINMTSSSNPTIAKSGTGTLNLTASNSWLGSGTFTLNDGVVTISHNNALGGSTGGTTITDNAALHLLGGITTNENITVDNSAGISSAGAIRSISGANTISSTVTIDNGTGRISAESGASLAFTNTTTALQTETGGNRTATFAGAGDFIIGGGGHKNNGTNVLSITKENTGLLTLSGSALLASAYTGATTVSAGTLRLDYSTNNTSKLADTNGALILNGGTVELFGDAGSHLETVTSTTLGAGSSSLIKRTGANTAVLAMNTITPGAGASVHFAATGLATTDNLNTTAGILGGWATITSGGATMWAVNSTNAADGPITAFAGSYTEISRYFDGTPAGTVPNVATSNVRIINGGTAGNITLASTTSTINTLRMDANEGPAVIATPGSILTIGGETGGGIIQSAASGALTVGAAIGDGFLTTGGTNNAGNVTLSLINDSTSNDLTINSVISNNGATTPDIVGLATDGAGCVVLAGTNTFTGGVAINAGTLQVGDLISATANGTLGANTVITDNGSLVFRRTDTTNTDVAGSIGGTGSVTYNGNGVSNAAQYAVNSASTYTGATTVGLARAIVTSATGFGTGPVTVQSGGGIYVQASLANNLTVSGNGWLETAPVLGAIRMNNNGVINGTVTLAANTRITADVSTTGTINGVISGGFNLDVGFDSAVTTNANGTVRLNGNNDYTGTTTLQGIVTATPLTPTLLVGHNNALGTTANGTTVIGTYSNAGGAGSQLQLGGGITVTDETLTLNTPTTNQRSGLMLTVFNGSAAWNGNIVLSGSGSCSIWSNATGSALTIGSSPTHTIKGTNSNLNLRGTSTGVNIVNSTLDLGTGALVKNDPGTWTITYNANPYTGQTSIMGGILSFSTIAAKNVASSIGAGTSIGLGQNSAGATGLGMFQFTGASGGSSDRTISINNGLLGGAGAIENTVAGQTLTLSGNITAATPASASALTVQGAGNVTLSGNVTASLLALTKIGAGTLTLSGANTYTGATTVSAGTLAFAGGSLTSDASIASTASLGLTTAATTTNTKTVTFATGAKVKITGTPTLASYTLLTASSISGTPVLETPIAGYELVVDGTTALKLNALPGFSGWITDPLFGLAAGDRGPTSDPEHDGMNNLLEYVLNGNPSKSDPAILPLLNAAGSTLVFSYNRLDASVADTTQTFQYGSDLTDLGWASITVPATTPPTGIPVGAATITIVDGATVDSVSISIPKTAAGANTKLFGRLQVTQP